MNTQAVGTFDQPFIGEPERVELADEAGHEVHVNFQGRQYRNVTSRHAPRGAVGYDSYVVIQADDEQFYELRYYDEDVIH